MRLYKSIMILLFILGLVSCQDVIDTEPRDTITEDNFWTEVNDLKLFVNNFYSMLSTPDQGSDGQSDNTVPNSPNNWLADNTTVPSSGGGWSSDDWAHIRNANAFLKHYERVDGNKDDIDQYLGEDLFFRAYAYFQKVKSFGDIPWINKEVELDDDELLQMSGTPRREVVDSILSDLDSAIELLKLPDEVDEGRIHKFAALQFQARVSLYEGTWMKYREKDGWQKYLEKAVAASQRIMDEGRYEIVKMEPQYSFREGDVIDNRTNTIAQKDYPLYYKGLFINDDLSGNPEGVLVKRFDKEILPHSISRLIAGSGLGVSKDFIEAFLCVDGKPIALSDLYKGDYTMDVEFDNRDPRLRNMINNRYLPSFLDGNDPVSDYLPEVNSGSPTGYQSYKYRSPIPEQNVANQGSFDLFVFRYAEDLLIYAEAKAELGTITQEDIDKSINKLRGRLDEPDLPDGKMARLSVTPPADPNGVTVDGNPKYGYSVPPLIYEIRRERRIELAFEGFRWDDIVRWNAGQLIENPKTIMGIQVNNTVIKEYNEYFDSNVFGGVKTITIKDWDSSNKELLFPYGQNFSRKWDDKLYLHPLPKDQLNLNDNLEQNPGWE